MDASLINGALIGIFMVCMTTIIFYEILRFTWDALPKLNIPTRLKMLGAVGAIFIAHTICVWLYGLAYYIMVEQGLGTLSGEFDGSLLNYIYYSAATYSSLGLGDIFPSGSLRMLTGIEVLNGLVLIGWSVSFTYLAMQQFWDTHSKSKKR